METLWIACSVEKSKNGQDMFLKSVPDQQGCGGYVGPPVAACTSLAFDLTLESYHHDQGSYRRTRGAQSSRLPRWERQMWSRWGAHHVSGRLNYSGEEVSDDGAGQRRDRPPWWWQGLPVGQSGELWGGPPSRHHTVPTADQPATALLMADQAQKFMMHIIICLRFCHQCLVPDFLITWFWCKKTFLKL